MSEVVNLLPILAQFIYILWPIFILVTIAYALWGFGLRGVFRRLHTSLLYTWAMLLIVWIVTLFASGPNLPIIPEPYNSIIFFGGFTLLAGSELLRKVNYKRLFRQIGDQIVFRMRARLDLHQVQALQDLKNLDPYQFEELVAELYRAEGYSVQRVGQSGDHGVDVKVFTPRGERWIIQCKRYRDTVGEEVIRELYGTLHHEGAQRAVLVTSAGITLAAEAWAHGKPIDLIDGPALLRWIEQTAGNTRPNFFDRLSKAIHAFFAPKVTFNGLNRSNLINRKQENTQQTFVGHRYRGRVIQPQAYRAAQPPTDTIHHQVVPIPRPLSTRPPECPNCHLPMVPRPLRPGDRPGRLLYRCQNYPECRVVVESPPSDRIH